MKKDIERLLEMLRGKVPELEARVANARSAFDAAVAQRKRLLDKAVNDLVHGTSKVSIDAVRRNFPKFEFPTVPTFLFFRKIDPDMTTTQLRVQLRSYLDSDHAAASVWVADSDREISRLQEASIAASRALIALEREIEGLERLAKADVSHMDPKYVSRLTHALGARIANPDTTPKIPRQGGYRNRYPDTASVHSDDGPNLLMFWLWSELASDHGSQAVTPRELNEGSGHAHHTYGEPASVSTSDSSPGLHHGSSRHFDEAPLASPVTVGHDTVEHHHSLGAQQFS